MVRIIVGRNGKQTVRSISSFIDDAYVEEVITLRSGKKVWRKNFNKMPKGYVPSERGVKTIRWANAARIDAVDDGITYNSAQAISKASNKPLARRIMKESDVSIPDTTFSELEAIQWINEGYTVIGRPAKHRAGFGVFVCNNSTDIFNAKAHFCVYYSKFYNKQKEFRVHCAHGKVLVLQEKVPREESKRSEVIWNHATNDFEFVVVNWGNYRKDVCKVALDAVKSLGLDFGAVDVMADATNSEKTAVVCEVNTSPSLCDYTTSRYVKYFKWLNSSEDRIGHYDYTEWSRGKSFAFKNCQLEV